MANSTRRSLSPAEHAIRLRFDAATREGSDELRARLWRELKQARARGARRKDRLYVRVRLSESPTRLAACLVSDLKIVSLPPLPSSLSRSHRIDAYASCELLFGPDTPPCKRPGPCPHDVVVYVLESDHQGIPLERRAYEAVRQMMARRPKMRTP